MTCERSLSWSATVAKSLRRRSRTRRLLSASGTLQCSPMYYVDDDTDAFVAFQNVTNSEQTVQLTCHYGTGIDGTPNGEFKNQAHHPRSPEDPRRELAECFGRV